MTLLLVGSVGVLRAQDFSSGYSAESSLPTGMIVSLVSQDEQLVEPANEANIGDLLGVVVGGSSSLLMISTQESNVQVVTSGLTNVLVTDEAGDISNGDFITVSSIGGIGRKATRKDGRIIGTAKGDFEDANIQTVRAESGDVRDVAVARIPVLIQVGGNPDLLQQESFLPAFLQEGANALAGEPVAPGRVLIALVVIIGGIVGSMVLLYGAVSSTIISIGRNPLSDRSIYAGLLRIVVIALGIVLFSLVIAYMIVAGSWWN